MKKIVHVISNFNIGGAQKLLYDLVKNCDNKKFEVFVISLYGKSKESLSEDFDKLGCEVYYLNKKPGVDLKLIIKLYRLFDKLKPDVVHTHLAGYKYSIIPLRLLHIRNVIHTEHTVVQRRKGIDVEFLIKKLGYSLYDIIPVGISNSVSESIIGAYNLNRKKVVTIYNGVKIDDYSNNNTIPTLKREVKLISVATFVAYKNHELLIEAIKILSENIKEFKLNLVGDGILKSKIKKMVEDYNLEKYICFLGSKKNVNELLADSDLFVISSKHEGFGLVLVEAMAAGLPIVATNVGGIPEVVIDNVNGILVNNSNPKQFAEAIEELINNKSKYLEMSKNNLRRAEKFDIKETINKYENLYFEVIKKSE